MMSGNWTSDPALTALLRDEYLQLQKTVEAFDGRALTIKAWSVTLSAAGIVTAYLEAKPSALLIASLSAIAFWLVEAFWKTSQQAFYDRLREIERFMAGQSDTIVPLQMVESWSRAWRKNGMNMRAFTILPWLHVAMPHVVIVIAGPLLYLYAPPS